MISAEVTCKTISGHMGAVECKMTCVVSQTKNAKNGLASLLAASCS